MTVMVIPGILLFVGWAALADRMRARFDRWQDKRSSGCRTTLSWIVGTAGFLLLLDALPDEIAIMSR
ncbi:hypothetical protein ACIBP6_12715 [Nonomuraea terrae]|uniref:hypothetical protein n=1 Tax=Nonomuraea terrae TaxID=2530383 RepID=UPI0037BB3B10